VIDVPGKGLLRAKDIVHSVASVNPRRLRVRRRRKPAAVRSRDGRWRRTLDRSQARDRGAWSAPEHGVSWRAPALAVRHQRACIDGVGGRDQRRLEPIDQLAAKGRGTPASSSPTRGAMFHAPDAQCDCGDVVIAAPVPHALIPRTSRRGLVTGIPVVRRGLAQRRATPCSA
jgi:hypothetical protein